MSNYPIRRLAIALQGGGSHGAFTWGVLDRLLEDPGFEIVGISGASAGAMNAGILADGLRRGGAAEARKALAHYWKDVGRFPGYASFAPPAVPARRARGTWSVPLHNRPTWRKEAAVGKTVVSSQMIDRVTAKLGRKLYEVPVGFKWFVDGLLDASLGFVGEESAGASFARLDGSVWTTDKDGITLALLAAEITARIGRDPGEIYGELTREFGESVYDRVEAPATPEQKEMLAKLSAGQVRSKELAGEKIQTILTHAPGNDAPLGGLKVVTESGWFAARPSGTENIYKIYAESFRGTDHLLRISEEAQAIVNDALATVPDRAS